MKIAISQHIQSTVQIYFGFATSINCIANYCRSKSRHMMQCCAWCLESSGDLYSSGCACLDNGKSVFLHPECVAKFIKQMSDGSEDFNRLDTCTTCKCAYSATFQRQIGIQYCRLYQHDASDKNVYLFELIAGIHCCDTGRPKEGLQQMIQCLKRQFTIMRKDTFIPMFTQYNLAKQFLKQNDYNATIALVVNMKNIHKGKEQWDAHDNFLSIIGMFLLSIAKIRQGHEKEGGAYLHNCLRRANDTDCLWHVLNVLNETNILEGLPQTLCTIFEIVKTFDNETKQGWMHFLECR